MYNPGALALFEITIRIVPSGSTILIRCAVITSNSLALLSANPHTSAATSTTVTHPAYTAINLSRPTMNPPLLTFPHSNAANTYAFPAAELSNIDVYTPRFSGGCTVWRALSVWRTEWYLRRTY